MSQQRLHYYLLAAQGLRNQRFQEPLSRDQYLGANDAAAVKVEAADGVAIEEF